MRRQYFGRYKKGDRMKRYGFGIDVGGTAIKMGLFTTDGELIEKWEIKTNKEDQGSRIFDDLLKMPYYFLHLL